MGDMIRVCNIDIGNLPVGLPITYGGITGTTIGKVISSNSKQSECVINDDVYTELVRSKNASFSLEVSHK